MKTSLIKGAVVGALTLTTTSLAAGVATAAPTSPDRAAALSTTTPIKHVVIIIGENHTLDNIFATYHPKPGQTIDNLVSKGIVTTNGQLGPRAHLARQNQATDTTTYSATPKQTGPYPTLPQPDTTHAKGQTPNVPDPRFPANLPNGPYQITHYVAYPNAYVGDPIHRFYQMWQQVDGGLNDLFTWVHQTSGDDNGAIPPAPIHQGAADMGYYNMAQGDAPVLKFMADHYALADNYHQSIMGGTGANHVAIGTGYAASYQANGRPAVPPANQIENPNPKPGTNNNYTQDGYAGGSYSDCSDRSAPGGGRHLQGAVPPAQRPVQPGGLRTRDLLPAQQLQPRLPGRWDAGAPRAAAVHRSPAVLSDHR